jgi:hypothetical protein
MQEAKQQGDLQLYNEIGSTAVDFASKIKAPTFDPEAPDPRKPDDLARQFQSAVFLANQYGSNVAQQDQDAFNLAIMQGNMGAAREIADRTQGQVEAQSKVSMEEQKELVELVDGSQVLVGKNTGNRYDPATRSVIPAEDARSGMDVYVAENMTAREEREKAFADISKLIRDGKDDEALTKYRSVESGGMFFKTATMDDLRRSFATDFIRRGMK